MWLLDFPVGTKLMLEVLKKEKFHNIPATIESLKG
jgi:hypothetical protein